MKSLIFLILVSAFTYGQEPDCQKFKTGKFKIIDTEYGNIIIIRTGSTITYYNEKTKLKTESELGWINDCTYITKNTKTLENPNSVEVYDEDTGDTTEIVKTGKNSYSEEYTVVSFMIVMPREVFEID